MKVHAATTAYRAGLVGAAISVIYTINMVWTYETGRSLLSTPGRYISREEMLTNISIGIALALLSWGCGGAVRYFLSKPSAKH